MQRIGSSPVAAPAVGGWMKPAFQNAASAAVAGSVPAAPVAPVNGLSTAEKNNLAKDPSVRAAMDLFGGEIVDIRKANPPNG